MSPIVAVDNNMEMLLSMAGDRCPILGTLQPEAKAAMWACREINRLRVELIQTGKYQVALADLMLFANAAAELDTLKNYVDLDRPEETYRIRTIVERMHAAIERAAGADGCQVYAPDDAASTGQTS